jgi:hypothetical protein
MNVIHKNHKDTHCKQSVPAQAGWGFNQCSRKAVKDGFCKQHHPDAVKAREEASEKKWEEKHAKSPWNLLKIANERIRELEQKLEEKEKR